MMLIYFTEGPDLFWITSVLMCRTLIWAIVASAHRCCQHCYRKNSHCCIQSLCERGTRTQLCMWDWGKSSQGGSFWVQSQKESSPFILDVSPITETHRGTHTETHIVKTTRHCHHTFIHLNRTADFFSMFNSRTLNQQPHSDFPLCPKQKVP